MLWPVSCEVSVQKLCKTSDKGRGGGRVPAPEQYCAKFDEHPEPCPLHPHRHISNRQKKSDSTSKRPAKLNIKVNHHPASSRFKGTLRFDYTSTHLIHHLMLNIFLLSPLP